MNFKIAYSLNIGLTNRCNLACKFCPVSKTSIKREDMPLDLVKKIIKESKISNHISLALFGESTLYGDLPEVIRMVKDKKVQSILYTNGLNVNQGLALELIYAGLDKIIFSLDFFTEEDYKYFKGKMGLSKAVRNMLRLSRYKREKKSKVPYITAQFADIKDREKSDLPEIIKEHVDKVKFGRFISWGGEIEWMGTQERKIREKKPCSHIFKFMNIASNGDMVLCCMDYNHKYVMGNVKDKHVMDVWNGDKFNKMREDQINGIFPDMCLNCENESYHSP